MIRGCVLGLVAAMVLMGPEARAAPVADSVTSFFVLGDSLSDNGNLYAATDGAVPASPPYFDGRFSNGPVWNEPILAEVAAAGLPTGNGAFGSARAVTDGDAIPDLGMQQAALFARAGASLEFGTRDVVALWFGGNDGFAAVGRPDQAARIDAAAAAIVASARALGAAGTETVLVFTLPDLGATPRYALGQPELQDAAGAASTRFNAALRDGLAGMRGVGLVDAAAVVAAARASGLAPLPCLSPAGAVCDDPSAFGFFDAVHPTAAVHRLIEAEARRVLGSVPAPVPLPAGGLLLAGAVAMLAARRGAARRERPV